MRSTSASRCSPESCARSCIVRLCFCAAIVLISASNLILTLRHTNEAGATVNNLPSSALSDGHRVFGESQQESDARTNPPPQLQEQEQDQQADLMEQQDSVVVSSSSSSSAVASRSSNWTLCWTNQISTDIVAVVDAVLQLRYYTFDATDLLI